MQKLALCAILWLPQCLVQLALANLHGFAGKNRIRWLRHTVQEDSLDVWHASSESFIDIYSSSTSAALPQALLKLPHQTRNITAQIPLTYPLDGKLQATSDRWNLSTLENTTYHSSYHPLYEIDEYLHALADLHPEEVELLHLGHSSTGREMYALRISTSLADANAEELNSDKKKKKQKKGKDNEQHKSHKLGIVISGAQHAREWVATSAALYMAHALLSNSSEPQSMRRLLNDFVNLLLPTIAILSDLNYPQDFYVVPAPNPDGYVHTWESDRFWYKNRQVVDPNAKCVGIDTNRNWGYKWKGATSKHSPKNQSKRKHVPGDPCSVWYPGNRPFQAPEVNNLANFVTALNGPGGASGKIKAYIDLRSYGQMLSSPYSYSCKRVPKDAEDQLEAALGGTQAIRASHGTVFKTGSLCSTLYRAPGNIVDWMYARAGIKYTYAAFLRDTGTYGFALPARWIRPVGEETGKMVEYIADFIIKQQK
ncbi:hypothetical protein HGRIS_008112 [Hohenbuehelia grisea]|uniref:Peptidase M14 domain-containing protein n=1 Tax=Hohenbuehelia grisea TaxID=104357 RepID=A0ABR3J7E2_9AGAR